MNPLHLRQKGQGNPHNGGDHGEKHNGCRSPDGLDAIERRTESHRDQCRAEHHTGQLGRQSCSHKLIEPEQIHRFDQQTKKRVSARHSRAAAFSA